MPTQFYGASSLDGFIATPDHDLGWLLQFGEIEGSSYPAFIRDVGALAMGSHTYEWMLKHAIDAGQPWPYAVPAWVFSSRSLRRIPGADVRLVRGDVRPVHTAMLEAAAGRNVWIVGGGTWQGSSMTRVCSTNSSCRSPRSRWVQVHHCCPAASRSHPCA